MSELTCLKLGVLMWIAHILTQSAFANAAVGFNYLASPRDETPEPHGVLWPRATRALHNYIENFVPFVAADLGLIVSGHTGGWGATIWILARIVYLPVYLAGLTPWRSLIWGVGVAGLVMMLWRLA